MKLHLPSGLRRAVYNSIFAVLISGVAAAPAYALTYDGITYKKGSTTSISGTVEENGKETFVSLTGDQYFTSFNMGNAHLEGFVPSTEETREDAQGFSQVKGHLLITGKVTIQSDSFVQMIEGHSLNATGQSVTIGTEGVDLQFMAPIKNSTYTAPIYGGVLAFYKTDTTHTDSVRTLTVGSLQTYSGAYVNDLKTFIVDSTKVDSSSGKVTAGEQTHYATSSDDMDVRRNSDVNGYILTDISGNDITIVKGDFSLDTEKTAYMSEDGTTSGEFNYDKMNTGDYGYVQSLKIGVSADGAEAGTSNVKALNDLQVVDGITIAEGSTLNMNNFKLETKSLSGQVTGVSSLTVGDFTRLTPADTVADFEHNEQGRQGEKDPAVNFEAELASTTASASVTGGTMDVKGDNGIYTVSNVTGTALALATGNFVLESANQDLDVTLTDSCEFSLEGALGYENLSIHGDDSGTLSLGSYAGTMDGLSGVGIINMEVNEWNANTTILDLSNTNSSLKDFTLNVTFNNWNATNPDFETPQQMTLIAGLTEASLEKYVAQLNSASTFAVANDEEKSYLVKLEVVQNGSSYDVVAKTQLVPEPTTATLALLALSGLAARRRRR